MVSNTNSGDQWGSTFLFIWGSLYMSLPCRLPFYLPWQMVVSWEEFCEHCCCTPDFPVFFAVSNQLHPFPPDFSPIPGRHRSLHERCGTVWRVAKLMERVPNRCAVVGSETIKFFGSLVGARRPSIDIIYPPKRDEIGCRFGSNETPGPRGHTSFTFAPTGLRPPEDVPLLGTLGLSAGGTSG